MNSLQILLRFDDICPTMNWEQWEKAKTLLDSVGATALLGVIPDNQDPDLLIDKPKQDFWEYIKQLQHEGYAIAMHGYRHVFDINADGIVTKKIKDMCHSEFAGHPYEVQFEKIRNGKEMLLKHGIETDIFFAPAHAYDDNTLRALAANGFRYISDGMSYKPYIRNGIVCVPARSGGVPQISKRGYYTIVLHVHEWVREDKIGALYKLQSICHQYKDSIVSFEEYSNRSRGNFATQFMSEKLYRFWIQRVRPLFVIIKHQLYQ